VQVITPPPTDRFAFGKNWQSFATLVDEHRIESATASLVQALGVTSLAERSFVDVGCGSGLFSLAANRLGARVVSFDYDLDAVVTTQRLRERFAAGADWLIQQGSILDQQFIRELGTFDVVYAWGVLHHTGAMWPAIDNAAGLVRTGGHLYLSIYNDQGLQSRIWRGIKRRYVRGGRAVRWALVRGCGLYFGTRSAAARLLRPSGLPRPAARSRGMSTRHDLVDWVGGYPFEVARPDQVFTVLRDRGFVLRHLKTCGGGLGCNEFVFALDHDHIDAGDTSACSR
jgi:2-polyprenyl-3-methyl-5-hydroxy-6-metoxy-1,4-benzoquinol methylase